MNPGRTNRFIATMLIIVFLINPKGIVKATDSPSVTDEVKTDFSDVKDKSKYYYEPVKWAAKNGITYGYDDGTFKPENTVTRAQMVTFLWRLCGSPEPQTYDFRFKDLHVMDYWFKATMWGIENGIVQGYKDNTFRAKNPCTRAQAVTFMYRMSDKISHLSGGSITFSDLKGKEKEYYYKPAYWGMKASIVVGINTDKKDVKKFNPKGKITRGQMVTFLYKLARYSTKTDGTGALKQNVMHTDGKVPIGYFVTPSPTPLPVTHSHIVLAKTGGVKIAKASSKDYFGRTFYDTVERIYDVEEGININYTLFVSDKVRESDFYIKYKNDEGYRSIDNCRIQQFIPNRVEPDIITEVQYKDSITSTSSRYSSERVKYMAGKGYTKAVTFKIICGINGNVGIDLYYKGSKLETFKFKNSTDCKVYEDYGTSKEIWDDISKYEGVETDYDIISAADYWIRNHSYADGYTCNCCDLIAALMSMKGHPSWTMYCAEKTDNGVKNDYYHYHTKCPRTKDKGDVYTGHVMSIIMMDKTHYTWVEVEGSLGLKAGTTSFSKPWIKDPDYGKNLKTVYDKDSRIRDYDNVFDMMKGDYGIDITRFDPCDCRTWY